MSSQDDSSRPVPLVTQTSGATQPETNSPFVFPGFQDPATMQDSYRIQAGTPEPVAGTRHPSSRSRPNNLSISALPAFEFGAGSASSESTRGPSPSPTRSPIRRTPPPHHSTGHRRGGSEFVGGDVTNPITAGVSPIKSEDLPLPLQKPSGPPTARRGHAHRRSGALSQHDLSMVLKPPSDNRGGSAPTTPCDLSFQFPRPSHPEMDRSLSQPASTTFAEDNAPLPSKEENNQLRARVTFNNDPGYIPRPLSTISSDTSSSMSTVRANHSVTDSITSVVSGGTSSPASARIPRFGSGSTDSGSNWHRNRSSSSLSHNTQQDQLLWSSLDHEPHKRPSSAPLEEAKDEELGLRENFAPRNSGPGSPAENETNNFKPSQHSPYVISTPESPRPFSTLEARKQQFATPTLPNARPRTSPEPKVIKRQKKVKSWAGSILSRKTKNPTADADTHGSRISTPPPPPQTFSKPSPDREFSLNDVTFDEDTTCIIETPRSDPKMLPTKSANYPVWSPHNTDLPTEYENPMLDIDAALGSLDRPGHSSTAFEGIAGFSNTKRRMHSSGETGGFSGPGMHYHRRAESAPELEFFDHSRLGFAHRGSNPAMAEAIEEEEEEEEEDDEGEGEVEQSIEDQNHSRDRDMGLGVNIVESGHSSNEPFRRRTRRKEESHQEAISPKTQETEPQHALSGVEIVRADEEPRFSVITKSSDGSTITPTLSPEPLAPTSTPLDFPVHTPSLTQASETASAISSPDFTKTSFDNHDPARIHTATSSITDRATLSSSRTGEHGHGSVDDVPSLTSSASTMISGHPTRFSSSANTTASSAERSSSLSAALPARTSVRPGSSKRSSLASLSRLVGSSYNKSKLNIAELAPPDSPEKMEKKRGKRMSRLMFWKSKEKLSS